MKKKELIDYQAQKFAETIILKYSKLGLTKDLTKECALLAADEINKVWQDIRICQFQLVSYIQ